MYNAIFIIVQCTIPEKQELLYIASNFRKISEMLFLQFCKVLNGFFFFEVLGNLPCNFVITEIMKGLK